MANILILGGGFGGLIAAEELSQSLGGAHQITLVSRSREFVFYPALVRVAFAACLAAKGFAVRFKTNDFELQSAKRQKHDDDGSSGSHGDLQTGFTHSLSVQRKGNQANFCEKLKAFWHSRRILIFQGKPFCKLK
ncbi:MAG: hypothetical protein LH614_21155 [Pyrinomonadaceae bacterium]|nr:hypothetical protein [Pyrinomonadaceae bacterium]